jgi:hypothetical protein
VADHRLDPAVEPRPRSEPRSVPPAGSGVGSGARRVAPLVLWMVCLVVGIVAFHALGTGRLAPPPLTPSEWGSWAAGRDPLLATVAVLRLVVLALAWYLVGATSIGLIARLLRAARLVRLADALTIPMVRRLLQGAVGLTMATAVVTASMPAASMPDRARTDDRGSLTLSAEGEWGDPDAPVTMTLANHDAGDEPVSLRPRPDGGELTLRGAGDGTAGGHGTDAPPASDALTLRPSLSPADPSPSEGDQAVEHEVRAGESFWSIAEATIAEAIGRQPTEEEVRDYWQTLVAANEDRLAVAGDADLIFPGQRFVVPPVDATVDPGGNGP